MNAIGHGSFPVEAMNALTGMIPSMLQTSKRNAGKVHTLRIRTIRVNT
ncbi:hypothetical protein PAMC26510_29165 [Caballeronia sordidicola]|uniref:Uncharacterized protein n=1 Tax=Caballeronia sordidicola TaxID=196367 RepID=A0A242N0L9_CABSO|nr:hypothetical protein PAMC26510_29165 [Caballeronia sordidicola]OTP77228.1 hypothetical protein PAMC26577_09680 [Caballeronia sordidicola]